MAIQSHSLSSVVALLDSKYSCTL